MGTGFTGSGLLGRLYKQRFVNAARTGNRYARGAQDP